MNSFSSNCSLLLTNSFCLGIQLAVDVGDAESVRVTDAQVADSQPGKLLDDKTAKTTTADYRNGCLLQLELLGCSYRAYITCKKIGNVFWLCHGRNSAAANFWKYG